MDNTSTVKVQVHYIAAKKPFIADLSRSTTISQLKADALKAFGLVEEGNKTFKLFFHKTELQNMNQTLGELAGDRRDLNLDLEEFIIQGN